MTLAGYNAKTDVGGDIGGIGRNFVSAVGIDSPALPLLGLTSAFVIISGGIGIKDGITSIYHFTKGKFSSLPLKERILPLSCTLLGTAFKISLVGGGVLYLPFRILSFVGYYVNSPVMNQISQILGSVGGSVFALAYGFLAVACSIRLICTIYGFVKIHQEGVSYLERKQLTFKQKALVYTLLKKMDAAQPGEEVEFFSAFHRTQEEGLTEDEAHILQGVYRLWQENGQSGEDLFKNKSAELSQLFGHKIPDIEKAQWDLAKQALLETVTIGVCVLGIVTVILGFIFTAGTGAQVVSVLWGVSNILWLGIDAYWLKKAFDRKMSPFQKVVIFVTSILFCGISIGAVIVSGGGLALFMVLMVQLFWMMLIGYCLYRLMFDKDQKKLNRAV